MEWDALLSSVFTGLGSMVEHSASVGWRIHEMICALGVEKQMSQCKGNSVKALPRYAWCHCKYCISRQNRWSKVEWHLGQLSMTSLSGQHDSL